MSDGTPLSKHAGPLLLVPQPSRSCRSLPALAAAFPLLPRRSLLTRLSSLRRARLLCTARTAL